MISNQNNSNTLPKYYRVKQIILDNINKNKYKPKNKLPSVRKLMKIYSVSFMTSRKIINELVRDGFAYTVQGKGCFVAVPDKKISDKHSRTDNKRIMVIIPAGRESNYFAELLFGVIDYLQPRGYNVEICNSYADYSKERNLLSKCIIETVSGLIFVPSFYNATYNHIFKLHKNKTPVVLVDQHIKKYDTDWVGLNNTRAAKKAVKYLIKLGHRKIVFLGDRKDNSVSQNRLEGYKQALRGKKIQIDPDLILDMNNDYYYMAEQGAQRRMSKFLSEKKKFTAVFAYNDNLAIGAYRVLREKKLRVPHDVSIIGFDDSAIARNIHLSLTTVRQDIFRVGYYAAKTVLERIKERQKTGFINFNRPEKRFINTNLIVRDSTRKID